MILKLFFTNTELHSRKIIMLQSNYKFKLYVKNKSYIGISFIILIFGIYAVPKIISRIQNGEIVKGIVWTMLKIQMYQRIS
jgi:hypothetical protein